MGAACLGGGGDDWGTELAGEEARLFFSGQWTHLLMEHHAEWLKAKFPSTSIKASMPPFNNPLKLEFPDTVAAINVPVFGVQILTATLEIFAPPDMVALSEELGFAVPKKKINKVVQSKVYKVYDLVKAARDDPTIAEAQKDAIDKVERLAKEFESLTCEMIEDAHGWEAWVQSHVSGTGWQDKLHFDNLLDNFGFDKASSDKLRKKSVHKDDGETITLENHAFRWLSKIFVGYGPQVMVTDIVNLIFAMMPQAEIPVVLEEKAITNTIRAFNKKVASKDIDDLWVPSCFVMDAESDDCLTWVLLEHIHRLRKTRLEVLVQLPTDPGLDALATHLHDRFSSTGCTVVRDAESKNAHAVKKYFDACK